MDPRISLITLGVRDLARATRFYVNGLGWRKSSSSGEQVTFLHTGGCVLALYPKHLLAEDAHVPNAGEGFPGFSLAHNVATRDEVDQVLASVVAAGATITCPAEDKFWGGYSGYFADPEGFLWEVAWNPFFPLKEDGSVALPG